MRWVVLMGVSIGLSGGCSRDNPKFGLVGMNTGASTSTSDGGSTSDATGDPSETSLPGTTGTDPGSTGRAETTTDDPDCMPELLELEPFRDTFLVVAEPGLCAGTPCAVANFGAVPVFPVRHQEMGFRSHLLMTFDLEGLDIDLDAEIDLVLFVGESNDTFQLAIRPVFPVDWTEGDGFGEGPAFPGESSWETSSDPMPWRDQHSDQQGAFELLLDEGMAVPTQELGPFGELENEVFIPIPPAALVEALEGNGRLELDVTQFTDVFDVEVFTRETVDFSPLLAVHGC